MRRVLSRIFVPARHRKDPRYEEDFATSVILAVSLRLALLLLLPSLLAIGISWNEHRSRTSENRMLIERLEDNAEVLRRTAEQLKANERAQAQAREENRKRFRRADIQLCRQDERLKRQNRIDARRSFNNLDRTLRVLELERTPEIEAIARENLHRDLKLNAPRKGGCRSLPSVNGTG